MGSEVFETPADMDARAVEAPEGAVEGTDAVEVTQPTDMVSREEYDALKDTFNAYRVNTIKVATKYGNAAGGCSVVDKAIAEIDPTMKRATYGAKGSVTLTLEIEITDSRDEVTAEHMWQALGNLAYELGSQSGRLDRVTRSDRKVTIVTPFAMTDLSTGTDVPDYVSPADWKAQETSRIQAKSAAERASNQANGYYGSCDECETHLTWRRYCPNEACDEYTDSDD